MHRKQLFLDTYSNLAVCSDCSSETYNDDIMAMASGFRSACTLKTVSKFELKTQFSEDAPERKR